MNTILPSGTLNTAYGNKVYKHLLKSARRYDHWQSQTNVLSLTKEEKLYYDRSRALKGALAELAFFKLLSEHNIEFIHNNRITTKIGTRVFERDIDFTLLPYNLNLDVKAHFSAFTSTVSTNSPYHAFIYFQPLIPKKYVEYRYGLSLIKFPQRVFKENIEVNALGIISVDKLGGELSVDDLIPLKNFFGRLKNIS